MKDSFFGLQHEVQQIVKQRSKHPLGDSLSQMGPLWVQVVLALLAQVVGARDEDNRLTNNNKEVVTLRTPGAFLETLGREGDSVLNVSIEVRTYQQSGLLLYHQLGKKGHVRLSVSEGVVAVEVVIGDDSSVHLAEWGTRVDDGGWHQVGLEIELKVLPDLPNFEKNIFSNITFLNSSKSPKNLPGGFGCWRGDAGASSW